MQTARFTASCLVERWYRPMTTVHAASSMSALVRALDIECTKVGLRIMAVLPVQEGFRSFDDSVEVCA